MRKSIIFLVTIFLSAYTFAQGVDISDSDAKALETLYNKEIEFFTCAGFANIASKKSTSGLNKGIVAKKDELVKYDEILGDKYYSKLNEIVKGKKYEYKVEFQVTSDWITQKNSNKIIINKFKEMKQDTAFYDKNLKGLPTDEIMIFISYDSFMKNDCKKFAK